MYSTIGKINFKPLDITKKHKKQSSWKKVGIANIGDDVSDYYSWFLKKRYNLFLNKPLRGSHVTIINDRIDDYIYNQALDVFNNKEISIKYDPTNIRCNEKGHWWIKVYSDDILNIRKSMGLSENPYFGLHLTIGRATHLQLEHSKYIRNQIIKFNI